MQIKSAKIISSCHTSQQPQIKNQNICSLIHFRTQMHFKSFLFILTTRVCFFIFYCSALRFKKYLKLFYVDMISDTKYG